MGPVEMAIREKAIFVKKRLETPKDRVSVLEEELRQLKRQVAFMTMQLGSERYRSKEADARAAVEKVLNMVSVRENVSIADLVSNRRTARVVIPRQICFYLAATTTIASLPLIGSIFNKYDHTSVLYGRDKIGGLRRMSKSMDDRIKSYEEILMRG